MPRISLRPSVLLATGFGAGYIPKAPGTAGAAEGCLLFLLLSPLPAPLYYAATVLVTIVAIWSSGLAEKALGVKDPPQVVIDEIAGQLIALAAAPCQWPYVLAGFALFRLFDIVKPWPVNRINDGVPGGAGIVLDDVAAGLYAGIILQAARMMIERL